MTASLVASSFQLLASSPTHRDSTVTASSERTSPTRGCYWSRISISYKIHTQSIHCNEWDRLVVIHCLLSVIFTLLFLLQLLPSPSFKFFLFFCFMKFIPLGVRVNKWLNDWDEWMSFDWWEKLIVFRISQISHLTKAVQRYAMECNGMLLLGENFSAIV